MSARSEASQRTLYLIAAVAQGAGPLLTQPFVQRLLAPDEWGRVAFNLSVVSISLIVILAGLPLVITRTFFDPDRGHDKARSLAGFGILQSLGLGAAAAAVLAAWFGFKGTLGDELSLILALFAVGLLGAIQMCLAVLRAQKRAVAFVLLTIGAQTVGHLAGLAAVLFVDRSATAYLGAFTLVVAVTAVFSALLVRPERPFAFPGLVRDSTRSSLPLLPHSIALVLMLQGESFVLNAMHGPASYGVYGAMLPMALGPLSVVLALANVWETTLLARRGDDSDGSISRTQKEALGVSLALVLLGSTGAVFAANILAHDLSSQQFAVARILPGVAVGYVIFLMATTQLVAVNRTRSMAIITPLVAAAQLGCLVLVSASENLMAVALVKVAGFAVLGVLYALIARRVRPGLVDLRLVLIGLPVTAAITALTVFQPTWLLLSVAELGLLVLLMAGGAVALRRRARSAAMADQVS
ncbi:MULTISPECIES: oligosaccharide flippase family protein [Arthrobacter]|uniref:Oligosaccharide flippase family protein n=2 Tax=Arthrobacter TaxID=1663 RepID=A0ABU9KJL2_9MICC|nr:oligosaccharide flippase family protein [Arthrobacter sp. YJM1]MDP5227254.1 oligosaccharide flippase family protein [Arthrobacter sp. YJM1]